MERGKVLCHFFLTIISVMSTSSFTMQTFKHDNSYIVMERGKFLSTMPIFFDTIFVMSTSSFTMQSFNDDNSYIVMERGKCHNTMPIFFDNISPMATSSFTMQIFKHDHSYIVKERGKLLSTMPIFFGNYSVMSISSFTMQIFNHIPILSWNVASSSVLCQFFFDNIFCHVYKFLLLWTLLTHDNSYIVMERGKFLRTMPSFFTIILSCLQVPLLC